MYETDVVNITREEYIARNRLKYENKEIDLHQYAKILREVSEDTFSGFFLIYKIEFEAIPRIKLRLREEEKERERQKLLKEKEGNKDGKGTGA